MNWWHYLLLANLYLALFYGFYLLLLRTETYFILNRIYLVSAAVLSFFIPMMQSEWVKNLFITQKVQQTIYYIDPGFAYQVAPTESGFTISQVFTTIYWLVSMLLLARLFYRFVLLRRYIQSDENGIAFSFFGKIKVDENLPQKEVILQHEMVHAEHFHSADVLLFEALTVLNWFNPIIYFYRKAIKHNHEFIADRDAISFGVDKADYAMLLLSQSMGVQPNHLVNSFFNQSLLKQRILMLHKNPSRRSALLKYGLSAPLFAAMLIFTSATVSEQKTILNISEKIGSDATVKAVAHEMVKDTTIISKTTNQLPSFPGGEVAFSKFLSTHTKPTYRIIDRLPTFPGGQEAFSKYLVSAIRYPKEAKANKIEGRVIVSFFVEKDGKLTELKVLRDVGAGLGAEALRVLATSPAWIPGSNEGKPLRVAFTMPINFSLDGKIKKMPNQLQLDSAKNPEAYKKMMARMRNMDNMTMSGFGGKDSARQRPPADVVRIQSKIMGIEPVYFLDGKEIDKNILTKINPNDIESIRVLKNKSNTAKYGDKGENDVVEIILKKATETNKP